MRRECIIITGEVNPAKAYLEYVLHGLSELGKRLVGFAVRTELAERYPTVLEETVPYMGEVWSQAKHAEFLTVGDTEYPRRLRFPVL